MRYAIVSDIHANLPAWKAVLLDIRSVGVDSIICLGDIVGYGPYPREVLESLYENAAHFVLGNHDAALCGKIDAQLFTDPARAIIQWTAERLGDAARVFLARLPLTLAGGVFRCAHANFDQPADFHYVFEPQDALAGWTAAAEPLLFLGHTHQPAIFVIGQSRTPRLISPEDFALEEGKRFMVNVGSVGQPRDGDCRASYCIFDAAAGSVFWRKVPFDLDAYRDALQKAGLPLEAAPFLGVDPRRQQTPLRERVNFSPPAVPLPAMRDTVTVQYLDQLKRRVRLWKMMFISLAILLCLAVIVGGWHWWRKAHSHRMIPGLQMQIVRGGDLARGSNFLDFPTKPTASGQPLRGWDAEFGDVYHQQVCWRELPDGRGAFLLVSSNAYAECSIVSAAIQIKGGNKLIMQAFFKRSPDFKGSVALTLELTRLLEQRAGTLRQAEFDVIHNFRVKSPNQRRADGWWEARETFELPANTHAVRLKIGGKFSGTLLVRDARLECPP